MKNSLLITSYKFYWGEGANFQGFSTIQGLCTVITSSSVAPQQNLYFTVVFNFMRELVYISKHLDLINKDLIIEEDKHSIWTYLLDAGKDKKSIGDGGICSNGTMVKKASDINEYIDNNFAPPLSEEYANEFSIQNNLIESDFKIETDKNSVSIYITDSIFVILDLDRLISYSKSVAKSGPYGEPLNISENNK